MSLRSTFIPYGEWLPDLGRVSNPGLITAKNVIPTAIGYKPMRGLSVLSGAGALMGKALHAHWIRSDTVEAFAADSTRLYKKNVNDWDDVSNGGAEYSPATDRWDFTSFGPHVIAVAKFIPPQTFEIGQTPAQTAFADLANAPASASTVASVRDFVVMGDVEGLGDNYIQWSGFNNITLWTPSKATQSSFRQLTGTGGKIQKIIGGDMGYIFRQTAIHSMEYIAPAAPIFRTLEFAPGRGTPSPESVVRVGNFIFYYDNAGFYQLDVRNHQFKPIGQSKVDEYVRDNVIEDCIEGMHATVDPVEKLVIWSMCRDSAAAINSLLLVYHYELQRWALWEFDHELIASLPSTSYTLDTLETVFGTNVDAITESFDSDAYIGGDFVLSAFDSSHKAGTFSGDWLDAEIETSEISAMKGARRIKVQKQTPYVEGINSTAISCKTRHRNSLTDNPEATQEKAMTSHGDTYSRVNARYASFNFVITGGFKHAKGVDIYQRVQ